MAIKKCSRCNTVKDSDQFSRSRHGRDGLQPHCKSCQAERYKSFYAANRDRQRQRAKDWKLQNPVRTKETAKLWREANRERFADTKKAYRANNPEKIKAARASAYAKNKDRENEKARIYKSANKDLLRLRRTEYLRENPEYNRFSRSLRRAAEKLATPIFADKKAMKLIYADAARKTAESGTKYHVDHIVPLQSAFVCGLHWEANLQVIPMQENQRKKNVHWPNMP